MNVEYSKPFLKAVDKLSGKVLSSVLDMIREVKNANGIDESNVHKPYKPKSKGLGNSQVLPRL